MLKFKHTRNYGHQQYKLLDITLDNIEVYQEPVARIKRIPHRAYKFEAGEENRIVNESLCCVNDKSSKLREWKEKISLFRRIDLCLSARINFNLTRQKRSPSLHFCFENRNLLLPHMNSDKKEYKNIYA